METNLHSNHIRQLQRCSLQIQSINKQFSINAMQSTLFLVGILMPFAASTHFFHDYIDCNGCCLKVDPSQNSSSAVLGQEVNNNLHSEIQQFYDFLQLTPKERAVRENVIARIRSLILELWPNTNIKLYGSFSYGLTLPTGDIDIMILENGNKSSIRSLATKIQGSDLAETDSIQVKDDLRIPIIEFIERESKINIDMTFLNEPTLRVAALLNKYKEEYPVFVKLVIVLKQFLTQRGLNDVFTGRKRTFHRD